MRENVWTMRCLVITVVGLLASQLFLIAVVQSFVARVEPLVERVESLEAEYADREMEVQLPDASAAVPLTVTPRELFINVEADGQYFINGETLDLDGLREVLSRAATNNKEQAVIVRADKTAPFEDIVQVINLCKEVGLRDYMANIASEEG